jgi:hypothetical protein
MIAAAPLTVALDARDPDVFARQRIVLASVPRRFLVVPAEQSADVVVVSGHETSWPDDVARAVDGGARGVLVADPGLADAGAVRRLASAVAGRAVVAVDTPCLADRTWTTARDEIAADAATASVVDALGTTGGEPDDGLLDTLVGQLAVVRPLVGSLEGLRLLHRGRREYVLAAQTAGPWVTFTGVTSAARRTGLALDVVAPTRRWEIRFDEAALARPTQVTVHDEAGSRTLPLIHESGHRVTWERLHQALAGSGGVVYGLSDLVADLELAESALRSRPANPQENGS